MHSSSILETFYRVGTPEGGGGGGGGSVGTPLMGVKRGKPPEENDFRAFHMAKITINTISCIFSPKINY